MFYSSGAVGKQNKLYTARSREVVKQRSMVLDKDMEMETESWKKMEYHRKKRQVMVFGCLIVGNVTVLEQTKETMHSMQYMASHIIHKTVTSMTRTR